MVLAKKVTISAKYPDFADVFLEESANVFSERSGVNGHAIELEKGKQSPYRLIYSLEPVEFKTVKTYIETNLATVLSELHSHQQMHWFCLYTSPMVAFACVLITKAQ